MPVPAFQENLERIDLDEGRRQPISAAAVKRRALGFDGCVSDIVAGREKSLTDVVVFAITCYAPFASNNATVRSRASFASAISALSLLSLLKPWPDFS